MKSSSESEPDMLDRTLAFPTQLDLDIACGPVDEMFRRGIVCLGCGYSGINGRGRTAASCVACLMFPADWDGVLRDVRFVESGPGWRNVVLLLRGNWGLERAGNRGARVGCNQ